MYILLFIFGAALGSFVNVIALRYNTGLSYLKGSSSCLFCGKLLLWHELIPLFSFLKLKGRCSSCYSRFSTQYFLVEIVSGLFLVLLFIKLGLSLNFFLLSIIYFILTIIFIYDLWHKIIPDSFVFMFILLSFLYSFFNLSIFQSLFSAILIPLPFFLIWLLSKGRLMGLGDIKLMIGMGLLLGLAQGISAVFLSFWIGGAFVALSFVYKKLFHKNYNVTMKSELPFAPFLVTSTIISFFLEINFFHL